MQGIISLLDPDAERQILYQWKFLEARFGCVIAQSALAPHLSWHVAESYPQDTLISLTEKSARVCAPFTIQTVGLGIFLVPEPVVYISIAPSNTLLDIHQRIFDLVEPISQSPHEKYAPGIWMPHITLAVRDFRLDSVGEMLSELKEMDFDRTIRIDNFSIFCPNSNGEPDICRKEFGKQ
jgi:2'-5' RNA ligase